MSNFFETVNAIWGKIPARYKNIYFWGGIAGAVLAAMGADPETFTSWKAVSSAFLELVSNPYMLACVTMAVVGVFVDPTTKGIRDK